MKLWHEDFGKTKDGQSVTRWLMENGQGTRAAVLDYGATLQSLVFYGTDAALGFDDMAGYEAQDAYVGAVIGRFANRIGGGQFCLNGKTYELYVNNGPNHLHGGRVGFDKKIWRTEPREDGLHFFLTSFDKEEGYPGRLDAEVRYALDEEDGLEISYSAKTDSDTLVNLTNHAYFNLNGHDAGTLDGQEVQIFADSFTENDENCLPTGAILSVDGSPMDFREMRLILERINEPDRQLKNGNGYDHNWILRGEGFRECAKARSRKNGITMRVFSDQPGMQFYTANFLKPEKQGKNGARYAPRAAFCMETQGFPDAVRHENFPSPILRAGEKYERRTVFRFEK